MWRTEEQFWEVKRLAEQGLSDYKIAAETGIPRGTLVRWRQRDDPPHAGLEPADGRNWVIADPSAYCYVRYFFTNHSADIRQIFIDHCELLGIRVT